HPARRRFAAHLRAGRVPPARHRPQGRVDRTGRPDPRVARAGAARRAAGARDRLGHPPDRRPDPRARRGRPRLPGLNPTHPTEDTPMTLQDKVAIVTGAASGIGKAIAQLYVANGARVAIADLDRKAADAAAREIDPSGRRALGVAMDVTDEAQVEAGTAAVIETWGRLDLLVSNAGIQIVATLVQVEFAKRTAMLAIHLDGAVLTTRAALRQMYKQKSGAIIYMGAVHSKEASLLKAPYVTAKHGLVGLAKVVAKEGAPHGVRANVICPGFVRTPLV